VAAALLLAGLWADERSEALELVGRMAQALSAGNAADFLGPFDRAWPGYEQLRTNVFALLEQAEVSSAVDMVEESGNADRRSLVLDWTLEIRSAVATGPLERRREKVKMELARHGKTWCAVSLEPVSFFAPPGVATAP